MGQKLVIKENIWEPKGGEEQQETVCVQELKMSSVVMGQGGKRTGSAAQQWKSTQLGSTKNEVTIFARKRSRNRAGGPVQKRAKAHISLSYESLRARTYTRTFLLSKSTPPL